MSSLPSFAQRANMFASGSAFGQSTSTSPKRAKPKKVGKLNRNFAINMGGLKPGAKPVKVYYSLFAKNHSTQ